MAKGVGTKKKTKQKKKKVTVSGVNATVDRNSIGTVIRPASLYQRPRDRNRHQTRARDQRFGGVPADTDRGAEGERPNYPTGRGADLGHGTASPASRTRLTLERCDSPGPRRLYRSNYRPHRPLRPPRRRAGPRLLLSYFVRVRGARGPSTSRARLPADRRPGQQPARAPDIGEVVPCCRHVARAGRAGCRPRPVVSGRPQGGGHLARARARAVVERRRTVVCENQPAGRAGFQVGPMGVPLTRKGRRSRRPYQAAHPVRNRGAPRGNDDVALNGLTSPGFGSRFLCHDKASARRRPRNFPDAWPLPLPLLSGRPAGGFVLPRR